MRERQVLCVGIPSSEIDPTFPHVEGFFSEACARDDDWTAQDFLPYLRKAEMQLWVVLAEGGGILGSAVTEVVRRPGGVVVESRALGGVSGEGWVPALVEVVEDWAREDVEALAVEVRGRPGLKKLFRPLGYDHEQVVVRKTL